MKVEPIPCPFCGELWDEALMLEVTTWMKEIGSPKPPRQIHSWEREPSASVRLVCQSCEKPITLGFD